MKSTDNQKPSDKSEGVAGIGCTDGLGDGKWHYVEQLKDGMLPPEIKTILLTRSLQDGNVLLINQPKTGWNKITGWHFFMPMTDAKVT